MNPSSDHNLYMQRCLELASLGLGLVAPNPMVGCVIVHGGKVIGEGYHHQYGGPHAEVVAVEQVKDQSLLKDSTLYVSLEPCSHHGKTPPCAEMIISKGIPRVVVACTDPNPKVAGRGMEMLKSAGVEVVYGVLEDESIELNRRFFTFFRKNRPYVILKWAKTQDGFIDRLRKCRDQSPPTWITNEKLRSLVHKWRTEEGAIMVGTRTALLDNPQLTAREWPGKNPLRIVLDRTNQLPRDLAIFDGSTPTLILTETPLENQANLEYEKLIFNDDFLSQLFKLLLERGIQSLIIEGGSRLLETFIQQDLWDEARVFTGTANFGSGITAPDFHEVPRSTEYFEGDKLELFRRSEE